ncbi:MAG: hypothetical protein E3J94_01645 [Desulfobacteraceae bacterium]|nr:MAG: hypothetical protein E3J94_01645 [Desulfobacteraceae bacterium]
MRKTIILLGCLLVIAAGCESTNSKIPLAEQVRTLRQEKKQLTRQIEQAKTEAEQLKKQVQVLSGLPKDKLENLYELQKIKITRYTDFYDKDKDGTKEKLIVYIQPIDEDDDIVKATGAVDIQLWDLNKADGQALLGQWHVKPDELKKLWLVTLITTNYRLTFDVADKIGDAEETLTVKVTFTDYLSGKVFKEQKAIKPH